MNILFIILASLGACIILLGVLYTDAYGYDYFEVNPFGAWYHEPSFCFVNVTEDKHKLIKGLTSWREFMPTGMTYSYKFTDSPEGCDVRIYYDNPILWGSTSPNSLGVADCRDKTYYSITNVTQFYKVETQECNVAVRPGIGPNVSETMSHEIGHVLGLGHRLPLNANATLGVIQTQDVMLWQDQGVGKITNEDIIVLFLIYGDGWQAPNNSVILEAEIYH